MIRILEETPGITLGCGKILMTFGVPEPGKFLICFQELPEGHGLPVGVELKELSIQSTPDFWIGFNNIEAIDSMIADLQKAKGILTNA